jgi:hypothetical protein
MLRGAAAVTDFTAGASSEVGPFRVDTWALPHHLPNAGLRLAAGGRVLAEDVARGAYGGELAVARPGVVVDLG